MDTFLWLSGLLCVLALLRRSQVNPPEVDPQPRDSSRAEEHRVTPSLQHGIPSPLFRDEMHSPLLGHETLGGAERGEGCAAKEEVEAKKPKWDSRGLLKRMPAICVARFMRLEPLVIACIFTNWFLVPGLGDGPFWGRSLSLENGACSRSWFANLLFFNNIWPRPVLGEESCAQWTW